MTHFVVFRIDGARHALPLAVTERVLPMVAVTPLPGAPDVVMGMISVHGEPVTVVDIRRRLALPPRRYGASAHLLVASTPRRRLSLPLDEVLGVEDIGPLAVSNAQTAAAVAGIASLPDGLVLIHDLDAFLSLDEDRAVERLLSERP